MQLAAPCLLKLTLFGWVVGYGDIGHKRVWSPMPTYEPANSNFSGWRVTCQNSGGLLLARSPLPVLQLKGKIARFD